MERVPLSTESLAVLIDFCLDMIQISFKTLSSSKLDVSRYIYLGNNALRTIKYNRNNSQSKFNKTNQ